MKMQTLEQINDEAAIKCSKGLTKLLERPTKVRITKVRVKDIQDLGDFIGSEEIVASTYVPLTGDVLGSSLLIFKREDAFVIADLLAGRPTGSSRKLVPMDEIALKEMGNVVVGNYFSIFSNSLQIKLIVNVPQFTSAMFGAVIDQVILQYAHDTKVALVSEVHFVFEPYKVNGYFVNTIFGGPQMEAVLKSLRQGT